MKTVKSKIVQTKKILKNPKNKKTDEYAKEWDEVWDNKGFLNSIVSFGRTIYNYFFFRMINKYMAKKSNAVSMLELGCGTGSFGIALIKQFNKKIEYTGVDISDSALRLATNNAKKASVDDMKFVKGDCFNLPFKEETFDIAWSQGLIEHFDAPKKTVLEHYRILKKGGRAYIIVPAKMSYHYLWWSLTRPKILRRFWPWTEQTFYTSEKFYRLMQGEKIRYRVRFIPPFILGVMVLELRKE